MDIVTKHKYFIRIFNNAISAILIIRRSRNNAKCGIRLEQRCIGDWGQMVHGTFQMFPQDKCWTCLTNEPCQYFIFVKYQEIPTDRCRKCQNMFDKRFPVVRCAAVSSVQVTDKGDGSAGEWAECSVTRVCLHGTSRRAPVIVLDPFAVTFSWSTFNTFRGRLTTSCGGF